MGDLIDRQAAIDEVVAWLKDSMSDKKNGKPLTERLKDLPSAQPEIIRCGECKHWDGEVHGGFYYFEHCSLHNIDATQDDFCSYAERREEWED